MNFITELVADRLDSHRPTAYRTIGKYVATDIIGRRAFSIVYKGRHHELGFPVVIKMMRHDLALYPDFIENFKNEAKNIAGLNHPNIVKVYDFDERYRTLFIILEHVAGNSLKEMIQRLRRLPPMLVADFVYQISTLVCVLLRDNKVYWVHVGDGRLYLLRNGRLLQITEDQTLARFLLEEGELTPQDAEIHYSVNVMDQYIGCGYAVPETGSFSVRSDDIVLLTTDGLHKTLTSEVIKTILNSTQGISRKIEHLIDAALKKRGQDNMTIVLAKV